MHRPNDSQRFYGVDQHTRPLEGLAPPQTADRLLKLDEVLAVTALGKSSLYAKVKDGSFPVAVQIGDRAVAWRASEVQAWISGLQRASLASTEG